MTLKKFQWLRPQTFVLALCAILISSHFWCDLCFAIDSIANGQVSKYSIKYTDTIIFVIFTFTCFFLFISTIGYFKQRIMQIRLCVLNGVLLTAYQIWLAVVFFQLKSVYTFSITAAFPIVCVLLLAFCIRLIWNDESLAIAEKIFTTKKKGKKEPK